MLSFIQKIKTRFSYNGSYSIVDGIKADGIKAIEEIMKIDKKANIVVISAMGQELTILETTEKEQKITLKNPSKKKIFIEQLNAF